MQELWFLCMTCCLSVLYKCMKFGWNTSNGYQVIEQKRNSIANDQREITQKYPKQSYGSCAWHVVWMCFTIVWSFLEISLWRFSSYRADTILWRTNALTVWYQFDTSWVLIVLEYFGNLRYPTRVHSWVRTDRRRQVEKTICLSTLPGGRHNYTKFFVFLDIWQAEKSFSHGLIDLCILLDTSWFESMFFT